MKIIVIFLFAILGSSIARDPRCPEDDEELIPFEHEDCTKFYQCDLGGDLWESDCDSGLVFDADTHVC